MAEQNIGAPREPLRFEAPAGDTPSAPASGTMTCAQCATAIGAYYYEAGGAVYCARCKGAIEQAEGAATGSSGFGRGAVYGLGAATLGAFGYWAVMRITGFDWALVSIAVAAFVATAIRKGNGGRGSRRFQLLAVLLTYLAIGAAYAPIFIAAMHEQTEKDAAASPWEAETLPSTSSTEASAADGTNGAPAARAHDEGAGATAGAARVKAQRATPGREILLYAGALILLALAGPVLSVMGGGFPGSLINLAIIGFALMKAWQLSGGAAAATARRAFTGPYKVGGQNPAV